jgi:hypothetical protein
MGTDPDSDGFTVFFVRLADPGHVRSRNCSVK